MQKILRYRKYIGYPVLISIFLLHLPLTPARAVMLTTEYVNLQDSEMLSDRARIRAFFARVDVMARAQAYGIKPEEALSRVDSLTDNEIALIADNLDHIPAGAGGNYKLDGSIFALIGMALYAILAAILIYFSFTDETQKEP